ncbi:A24 family peptidase [Enterovibrio norvegicus]|uniref:A24 family peptidase n=1 Tax=Enterovibrio norvegicus TaxID=188144 RepID=UPI000C81DB40|nr:A24 family peptidase [Enterovibrio norvegicus]MCC4797720.1 A24 family peptidase [Enterovibrio norvegicus]TKF19077.1 prepilin peptidase [Enterovibrio norvegicus]TKF34908.1 prepilin peptidase [Enterovibrio norvegicus]
MLLDIVLLTSSVAVIISDLKYRKISNFFVLTILTICILISVREPSLSIHVDQSILVLLVGLVLFRVGVLAAGDTKLFAVYSLVINPEYIQLSIFLIAFIGGIVAVPIFVKKYFSESKADRGVPYGIPIVLSSLFSIYLSKLS